MCAPSQREAGWFEIVQPSKGLTHMIWSHVFCPFVPNETLLPRTTCSSVFEMFLCSNTPDADILILILDDKELLIVKHAGHSVHSDSKGKGVHVKETGERERTFFNYVMMLL